MNGEKSGSVWSSDNNMEKLATVDSCVSAAAQINGSLSMTETEFRPKISVLHSLRKPDGTTGYVDHMIESAPAGLEVLPMSWKTALIGKYDVFHIHWPEYLVRAKTVPARVAKKILFVALVARLRMTRTPIVRTAHNIEPHETGSSIEAALLRWCDRKTDHFICLNVTTQVPEGKPHSVILHGHYRDRPDYQSTSPSEPNRLLYFGLIRPYKGIEDLISAFGSLGADDLNLRIVGKPQSDELANEIRSLCCDNPSISTKLAYVPDSELAEEIARSALVVLPYREMHNSGSVILALSMNRPVLVPDTPANRALRDEVGPGWIYLYDDPVIDAATLRQALDMVATDDRPSSPDLSARDWDRIGEKHYAAYAELLGIPVTAETRGTVDCGG